MLKHLVKFWTNKSKKKIIISSFLIIIVGILGMCIFNKDIDILSFDPTISLEPPSPVDVNSKDEIIVDVKLSKLPTNIYPAASLSVGFDNNKLEFTGVKMGTMETYGDEIVNGSDYTIPTWDCDVETSNSRGQINAMYLDMTTGKFAYNADGFEKDTKDIVLRIAFKLKDSAQRGDTYYLEIKDAVFATIDGDKDKTSLSTVAKTLKSNDCSIVVQK